MEQAALDEGAEGGIFSLLQRFEAVVQCDIGRPYESIYQQMKAKVRMATPHPPDLERERPLSNAGSGTASDCTIS